MSAVTGVSLVFDYAIVVSIVVIGGVIVVYAWISHTATGPTIPLGWRLYQSASGLAVMGIATLFAFGVYVRHEPSTFTKTGASVSPTPHISGVLFYALIGIAFVIMVSAIRRSVSTARVSMAWFPTAVAMLLTASTIGVVETGGLLWRVASCIFLLLFLEAELIVGHAYVPQEAENKAD